MEHDSLFDAYRIKMEALKDGIRESIQRFESESGASVVSIGFDIVRHTLESHSGALRRMTIGKCEDIGISVKTDMDGE